MLGWDDFQSTYIAHKLLFGVKGYAIGHDRIDFDGVSIGQTDELGGLVFVTIWGDIAPSTLWHEVLMKVVRVFLQHYGGKFYISKY